MLVFDGLFDYGVFGPCFFVESAIVPSLVCFCPLILFNCFFFSVREMSKKVKYKSHFHSSWRVVSIG